MVFCFSSSTKLGQPLVDTVIIVIIIALCVCVSWSVVSDSL